MNNEQMKKKIERLEERIKGMEHDLDEMSRELDSANRVRKAVLEIEEHLTKLSGGYDSTYYSNLMHSKK